MSTDTNTDIRAMNLQAFTSAIAAADERRRSELPPAAQVDSQRKIENYKRLVSACCCVVQDRLLEASSLDQLSHFVNSRSLMEAIAERLSIPLPENRDSRVYDPSTPSLGQAFYAAGYETFRLPEIFVASWNALYGDLYFATMTSGMTLHFARVMPIDAVTDPET